MTAIVRPSLTLLVVAISVIVLCSTQPDVGQVSQDPGQNPDPGQDPDPGQRQGPGEPNRTLAYFIQAREDLRQRQLVLLQGRPPIIWDNALDQDTCGSLWNIQFGDKCDEGSSTALRVKFGVVLLKYNVDEETFVVNNDPSRDFPLAADREFNNLICAGRPKQTICVAEKCACPVDPCEERPLPTAITLAECNGKVDLGPLPTTTEESNLSTGGLDELGIANGTSTPSPRRQPQGHGQLLIILSVSVSVTLAPFGVGVCLS